MSDPKPQLKLFVVGESSGLPSQWSDWSTKAFVIAESGEQALEMMDRDPRGAVAELVLESPCVLMVD